MDFLELAKREGFDVFREREFSSDERKQLAKDGKAMPDGSYPIENVEDLHNAIKAVGRGNASHAAIREHIKKRAKALGQTAMIPDTWGESARALFANFEALDESAILPSGNLTLTVIKSGWSKNNRYYPAPVLTKSANLFEGAKMFVDHATDSQERTRPEGSIRDWVGTIGSVWAEGGAIKANANVHNEAFKTELTNLKKAGNLSQMGISIRAIGEAKPGEAEGRTGPIVESILGVKSVDFVTFAAAGGKVESMSEAIDPDDGLLWTVDDLREKRPDLVEALTSNQHVNAYARSNPFDKTLADAHLKAGRITESQYREVLDLPPAEYEQLEEKQKHVYDECRLFHFSVADSLTVARLS